MNKKLWLVGVVFVTALAVFVFIHAGGAKASSSLFFDGFESGNLSAWTSADTQWIAQGTTAHTGVKRATGAGPGIGSLAKAQSTAGFQNLSLSYWWKIQSALESTDHVTVEWGTDGATWNQLADHTGAVTSAFEQSTIALPVEVADLTNFEFRFHASLSNGSDVFWLDDVELTGDLIVTPTPSATPSGSPEITPTTTPTPTETPTVTITGHKWNDADGNGAWDEGEQPMEGWAVALGNRLPDTNPDDQTVPIEIVALALTGADGKYVFTGVTPGQHEIFEENRDGWNVTNPAPRTDSFFDITYSIATPPLMPHSFFDVFTSIASLPTIDTDGNKNPLRFGNHAVTPTPTPTEEPTPSPTPEPTVGPTPTLAITPTPEPTIEPTPTPTEEPMPTPTPELTPTPSPSEEPTSTPELTPTPTASPSASPSGSPEITPTTLPTPSTTPTPTPTPTIIAPLHPAPILNGSNPANKNALVHILDNIARWLERHLGTTTIIAK